jgi:hypothetical protein
MGTDGACGLLFCAAKRSGAFPPNMPAGLRARVTRLGQVSATSLKLLIQQVHPHVRVERDSGMCVARDHYELWGRSPYTRMFLARTSH